MSELRGTLGGKYTKEQRERFLTKLDAFLTAADELDNVYINTPATTAGGSYPTYLPSFDEFVHDMTVMRDDFVEKEMSKRTFVVRLSIEVPADDKRTPGQIDDDLRGMFGVAQDGAPYGIRAMQLALGTVEEYRG